MWVEHCPQGPGFHSEGAVSVMSLPTRRMLLLLRMTQNRYEGNQGKPHLQVQLKVHMLMLNSHRVGKDAQSNAPRADAGSQIVLPRHAEPGE